MLHRALFPAFISLSRVTARFTVSYILHFTTPHTNQDAPADDMRLDSHGVVCFQLTWSKLGARDRWTRLRHQVICDGRDVESIRGQMQSCYLFYDCHGCWSWLSHSGLSRATLRGQFMDR
jgi:hypothetical protein